MPPAQPSIKLPKEAPSPGNIFRFQQSIRYHLEMQNPFLVEPMEHKRSPRWVHQELPLWPQVLRLLCLHKSPLHELENGVPQGSVISPILFDIAINDILNEISPSAKCCLFVDDLTIFVSCKEAVLGEEILQDIVNKLSSWSIKVVFDSLPLKPQWCNSVELEVATIASASTWTIHQSPPHSHSDTSAFYLTKN